MNERGMIFTAESVRAILAGTKWQTRRAVGLGNSAFNGYRWPNMTFQGCDWANAYVDTGPSPAGNPGPYLKVGFGTEGCVARVYPKWQVGDRLYVKEAWTRPFDDVNILYRATDPDPNPMGPYAARAMVDGRSSVWMSPLFMPRAAARIWLEICEVRVQRVQEITGRDAKAEGASALMCYGPGCPDGPNGCNARGCIGAREWYAELWDAINGKKPGCSFEANPWVFAITFRKVETP